MHHWNHYNRFTRLKPTMIPSAQRQQQQQQQPQECGIAITIRLHHMAHIIILNEYFIKWKKEEEKAKEKKLNQITVWWGTIERPTVVRIVLGNGGRLRGYYLIWQTLGMLITRNARIILTYLLNINFWISMNVCGECGVSFALSIFGIGMCKWRCVRLSLCRIQSEK